MAVEMVRHQFTVDEYHHMAQAGILAPDARVELLDGEIVEMSLIGPRRTASVNRCNRLFTERLGRRAIVSVQNSIRLNRWSEPQPDVALLRPLGDFYAGAHPRPNDTLPAVEVADTSLAFDRQVKAPLYARAGIVELWLLDVEAEKIEVYRQPSPGGYGEVLVRQRGERIAPLAFPDLDVLVDDLLP